MLDDVIPKQKCIEIINKFNADNSPDKKKGRIKKGVDLLYKNSTDLHITSQDNWTEIDTYFKDLINDLIRKYNNYIRSTFNSLLLLQQVKI